MEVGGECFEDELVVFLGSELRYIEEYGLALSLAFGADLDFAQELFYGAGRGDDFHRERLFLLTTARAP